MSWKELQTEQGAQPASAEDRAREQLQDQIDRALPIDPGHVRTRKHYEAQLREQLQQK